MFYTCVHALVHLFLIFFNWISSWAVQQGSGQWKGPCLHFIGFSSISARYLTSSATMLTFWTLFREAFYSPAWHLLLSSSFTCTFNKYTFFVCFKSFMETENKMEWQTLPFWFDVYLVQIISSLWLSKYRSSCAFALFHYIYQGCEQTSVWEIAVLKRNSIVWVNLFWSKSKVYCFNHVHIFCSY